MTAQESYKRVDGLVEELQATSKFEREKLSDGREVIRSPEAGEFFIRKIEDVKDPAVEKMYELLVKEFSEEEADTPETIRGAIESDIQAYHVVEDAKGHVIALSNTEYLKLESSQDAMIFIAYVATDPGYRRLGIGSELYPGFYDFAKEKAKQDQARIKGVIGEAVGPVESFLNRMGRKRMYFEDEQGSIHEVPYIQAPLDWSEKTGKPRQKATPEHLMIRLLDERQEMQVSEVISMVKAIYEENYIFPEDYFKTEKAYQACEDTVMGHLKDLEVTLQKAKGGKIFLMDKKERAEKQKELEAQGKQIFEWGKETAEEKKEAVSLKTEPLTANDRAGVVEILKQHSEYFTENDINTAMSDFERHLQDHQDDVHYFVVRTPEGKIEAIGGYGKEKLSPDVYFIGWFAVDKNVQRKKLGGELLEKIEEEIKDKARMIIIRAEEKGEKDPTALFYSKHGYEKGGSVPDYWQDGSDLVFWSKRLKPREEREKE